MVRRSANANACRTDTGRAVLGRAAGTVCGGAGGPAERPPPRATGPPSASPAARERAGPRRVAPGDRRREPPDPHDFAGRRLAAEQLPHRRRAGPGDPGGPSAGVLSGAAEARRGRARRLSPRLRVGLVVRRAHRQPDRPRDLRAIRAGLPAGPAAHDRRALGAGDLAATGPRRESPETRGAGRGAGDRARPSGRDRRRSARHGRRPQARAERGPSDAGARAVLAGLRRPARSAPARAGPGGHARARVARPPIRAGRNHGRGDRARGAPAADRQPRDGSQRDHEHAPSVVGRLGRFLRKRQPGSRGSLRRDPRGRDGLRDAGPVSTRRRGAFPGKPPR